MMTQTPRVAFSQNLGEMLNLLQYRIDSVLINEDGQPEAVLINSRLFNCICRLQNRFDVLLSPHLTKVRPGMRSTYWKILDGRRGGKGHASTLTGPCNQS